MNMSRQAALDKLQALRLAATPALVRQGIGNGLDDGDIDFWGAREDRGTVSETLQELGALDVVSATHPRWANHDVWVLECDDGILQLDIKYGDMRVGPLTIATEAELLARVDTDARFTGTARIADVMIRRLARGKTLDDARLDAARSAWRSLDAEERESYARDLIERFGDETAEAIGDLLEGREPAQSAGDSLRMQVRGSYLSSFGVLGIAISKALAFMAGWASRRPRPYGQYPQGVIVTISGTDGTGKSTTLDNVERSVRAAGLRVYSVYLGRGRGNLKPVAMLRDIVSKRVQNKHDTPDVYRSPTANKGASWLYAFEYFLRTLRPRLLRTMLGGVVICDRYCYDIALIPGASPAAVRVARWLCPRPDLNVVLHAPAEIILARKEERSEEELEKQQATLLQVITNNYARFESLAIDTNENDIDATRDRITRAVLQLAHRRYRTSVRR